MTIEIAQLVVTGGIMVCVLILFYIAHLLSQRMDALSERADLATRRLDILSQRSEAQHAAWLAVARRLDAADYAAVLEVLDVPGSAAESEEEQGCS